MNRREFTVNLSKLITYANETLAPIGCWVVVDYVKRSDQEQARLFDEGLSQCDGIHKRSLHQGAVAVDLYPIGILPSGKQYMPDPMKAFPQEWNKIRTWWVDTCNGGNMIPWDACHFE